MYPQTIRHVMINNASYLVEPELWDALNAMMEELNDLREAMENLHGQKEASH